MKKTVLMLAVGGLMLATPSCKKGENDPFMSLSSRKARISGEWTVASYEWSDHDIDGSDNWHDEESFDGTNVTSTYNYNVGGVNSAGNGSDVITYSLYDFIINKDGTYETHENKITVSTGSWGGFDYTDTETFTSTITGSWSFVGKAKDEYKNKERVSFSPTHVLNTSQTTTVTDLGGGSTNTTVGDTDTDDFTFAINEIPTIYDIDMLKGKEMTLMMVSGGTYINSSTSSGGSTTSSTNSSETMMTIQLIAK